MRIKFIDFVNQENRSALGNFPDNNTMIKEYNYPLAHSILGKVYPIHEEI